jgi:hypothetical protein
MYKITTAQKSTIAATRLINPRLGFALGCALFAIYGSAANAQMASTQELRVESAGATSIEAHDFDAPASVIEYPSEEKMLKIYNQMNTMGLLVPGNGPLYPNLDSETLKAVYRYALEIKFADEILPRVTAKAVPLIARTQACNEAYAACAVGTVGALVTASQLSCAAAAFQWGLNVPNDAACAAAAALGGVAGWYCGATLLNNCKHTDKAPVDKSLALVGVVHPQGRTYSKYCTSGHVQSTRFATKGGRVAGLRMTCADGHSFEFGDSSQAILVSQKCAAGSLPYGYHLQAGDNIVRMGTICKRVGTTHSGYSSMNLTGGSNVFNHTRTCESGQYVIGATVHTGSSGWLHAVKIVCSGNDVPLF